MIETDRTGRYSSTTGSETKHGLLVPVHQTLPGRGRRSGQNMPVRLRRRSSVFRGTARLVGVGLLADPSCGRTFGRADREIGPYAIVRDRHPSAKNGGPGDRAAHIDGTACCSYHCQVAVCVAAPSPRQVSARLASRSQQPLLRARLPTQPAAQR